MQRRKVLIFTDPRPTEAQKKARLDVTRELFDAHLMPDVADRNRVAANISNCWEPGIDIVYVNESDVLVKRTFEEKNRVVVLRDERPTEIRVIEEVKKEPAKEPAKKAEKKTVERTKDVVQAEFDDALEAARAAVEKAANTKTEAAKAKAEEKALALDAEAKSLQKELEAFDA